MTHDHRTDFAPQFCEYFEQTYLNLTGWNGHLSECPVHGGA